MHNEMPQNPVPNNRTSLATTKELSMLETIVNEALMHPATFQMFMLDCTRSKIAHSIVTRVQ